MDYDVKVYSKENLVSKIHIRGSTVTFRNNNFPAFMLPFGISTFATLSDLKDFYESRCFPRDRVNCKEILKKLGVDSYEPELICRKTHGLQFDDFIWLQFSDEPQVCWNDIKLRD